MSLPPHPNPSPPEYRGRGAVPGLARRRWSWRRLLLPGGLALCGLLLDIVLKALLAPVWPELMRASF